MKIVCNFLWFSVFYDLIMVFNVLVINIYWNFKFQSLILNKELFNFSNQFNFNWILFNILQLGLDNEEVLKKQTLL